MRKITSLLFLVSILFSCDKDDPNPAQLIVNGNVESGTANPTGWVNYSSPGITNSWTSDAFSSSNHSLKITSDTGPDDIGYWTQNYNGAIPIGKDLTLRVKIKCDNLDGEGVSIAISADDSTPTAIQFSTTQGKKTIDGTFDWTLYDVTLEAVDADAKNIYVFLIFLPNTTGTVYFDDASLEYN
jgi:hypothetical protein